MFNSTVMDHFQNPRNTGEIVDADGIGEIKDPTCGDVMRLYIKVNDGCLVDAKYKTFGCAGAIAASSAVSEMIMGKSVSDASSITPDDISDKLQGLPESKLHCSTLAAGAVAAAIQNYMERIQSGT